MKISYLKWLLLLFGAIKFGVPGAFIGFFIGQFLEEFISSKPDFNIFSSFEEEEDRIEITDKDKWMLVLVAGILQLNSFIPKEQSHFILKYFFRVYGTEKGKALYAQLKVYLHKHLDVAINAKRLNPNTRPEEKIRLMTFLIGLCYEGKSLLPAERSILTLIGMNLGISQYDFERLLKNNTQQERQQPKVTSHSSLSAAFITLGLSEHANESEVKKAYRKLVLQFHPDKTDLPDELASKKFQEVHEAYHRVKEARAYK